MEEQYAEVRGGCRLVRRDGSGVSWGWPALCVAAVLYGSLLPLDVTWSGLRPSTAFGLAMVGWHGATVEDVVVNVLVYVPIGASLMLTRLGLGLGAFGLIAVLLVGGGVSVLAETMQTGAAERVASWADVTLNTFGVFVGATGAAVGYAMWPGFATSIRRRWTERPFELCGLALTLGVLVYGLVPFDFVTTTPALHAAFRRAQCGIASGLLKEIVGGPIEQSVSTLCGAAWFALLGYVGVLAAGHAGTRVDAALGEAVQHAVLLAVLLEVLQTFTTSHVFQASTLVFHSVGAAAGAWYASFLADGPPVRTGALQWGRAFPRRLVAWALLFQLLMIGLLYIGRADGAVPVGGPGLLPFEAMWRLRPGSAFSELVGGVLTFGALAATMGGLLASGGWRRPWAGAVLGVLVTVAAWELLGRVLSGNPVHTTSLVLAVMSAVLVARVGRYVGALETARAALPVWESKTVEKRG